MKRNFGGIKNMKTCLKIWCEDDIITLETSDDVKNVKGATLEERHTAVLAHVKNWLLSGLLPPEKKED